MRVCVHIVGCVWFIVRRVLVMHQGRHSGELARQAVTVDRMMTLAFGGQA